MKRILVVGLLIALATALFAQSRVGTVTATITDGNTVSAEVQLGRMTVTHMLLPASFEGTSVTFDVTLNGSTWYDLYDQDGTEVSVAVSSSRAILLQPADFIGVLGFRITSSSAQTGDAVVTFVTRGL